MRKVFKTGLLCVGLLMSMGSSGWTQVCGDVTDDGQFAADDISAVLAYWDFGTPLAAPERANVDGRFGFTISDLKLFLDPGAPAGFDCSPDTSYRYSISLADTVEFQAVRCLQNSASITLSIRTRFSNEVEGFYLPVELAGGDSRGIIASASVNATGSGAKTAVIHAVGDSSAVLVGTAFVTGDYAGARTMFEITFSLDEADCYTIWPGATDFAFGSLFAVLRNGDLYRPVIVYDITNTCPPGDVNCNCVANLTDVTLLVNSLFITGVPLVCQ